MRAFYEDLGGGRFRASESTAGPWRPDHQHRAPRLGRGSPAPHRAVAHGDDVSLTQL